VGSSFPAGDGCNECSCQEGGSVACTTMACPGCYYEGQAYQPGDTFPAGDGCNECSCEVNGGVSCTWMSCPQPMCNYLGASYPAGASFPDRDGCNTCTCDASGAVGCTKLACLCDSAKEWWRQYLGNSPAECARIDFLCPSNTTIFQNDCGCGCEQSVVCPEFIDCMPPSPCTPSSELCPYSGRAF